MDELSCPFHLKPFRDSMNTGMPSVALLFYHHAAPVLTEKQTFGNGIPLVITYKIKCLQHNGKVIEFLSETETLLIFYSGC